MPRLPYRGLLFLRDGRLQLKLWLFNGVPWVFVRWPGLILPDLALIGLFGRCLWIFLRLGRLHARNSFFCLRWANGRSDLRANGNRIRQVGRTWSLDCAARRARPRRGRKVGPLRSG